jgi:hypothetical protein
MCIQFFLVCCSICSLAQLVVLFIFGCMAPSSHKSWRYPLQGSSSRVRSPLYKSQVAVIIVFVSLHRQHGRAEWSHVQYFNKRKKIIMTRNHEGRKNQEDSRGCSDDVWPAICDRLSLPNVRQLEPNCVCEGSREGGIRNRTAQMYLIASLGIGSNVFFFPPSFSITIFEAQSISYFLCFPVR